MDIIVTVLVVLVETNSDNKLFKQNANQQKVYTILKLQKRINF